MENEIIGSGTIPLTYNDKVIGHVYIQDDDYTQAVIKITTDEGKKIICVILAVFSLSSCLGDSKEIVQDGDFKVERAWEVEPLNYR